MYHNKYLKYKLKYIKLKYILFVLKPPTSIKPGFNSITPLKIKKIQSSIPIKTISNKSTKIIREPKKNTQELETMFNSFSKRASWLTYLGMVPFLICALAIVHGFEQEKTIFILRAYAAVIVSFISGIHWGITAG